MENGEEFVKWYGKYGRKVSCIVKRHGKYRRKVSWKVKRYGNYGRKVSWIKVITKLPNSEQSYKGKVKTHNYINRQISQKPEKQWKP